MTRSTDTSDGCRYLIAEFGHGFEHWLGTTRVDHHPIAGWNRHQRRFERSGNPPAHSATAIFGRQDERYIKFFEEVQVEELAGPARAIEKGRLVRDWPNVSARVANGASPTPPATIQAS